MRQSGERVLAAKGDGFYYPATVRAIDGERCFILHDDGDDAFVDAAALRPLALAVGERVLARLPTGRDFLPAAVLEADDHMVRVQWDGGEDNWVSLAMLRLSPPT